MPAPLLIVELPAGDSALPEAAALVQACTEGLGGGSCELAGAHPAQQAAAIAVVSWRNGEELGALVELGKRRKDTQSWRTEELSFQAQDARLERFRTVGLAIATLFRETEEQQKKREEREAAAKAKPAAPAKSAANGASESKAQGSQNSEESTIYGNDFPDEEEGGTGPRRKPLGPHALGWLDASGIAAYDRTLFSWRFGGRLDLGYSPLTRFPLYAAASGSYESGGSNGLSLTWATFGLGAGGFLTLPANFELRGQLQGIVENVAAGTTESGSAPDQQSRWQVGFRGAAGVLYPARGAWGFAFSGEVQQVNGATRLEVRSQPRGNVGAMTWGIIAGLELRPFQR